MAFKVALLGLVILLGCHSLPSSREQELRYWSSFFFDHTGSTSRIVGGSQAGAVPYMGAMVIGERMRQLVCGSSIVTQRHVLSAAHCLEAVGGNKPRSDLRIVVGTNRWSTGGDSYALSRGIVHPDYDARKLKNDVGILITSTKITLKAGVQLMPVNYDYIQAGVPARIAGWGRTRRGGSVSPVLLALNTTVTQNSVCVKEVARRGRELGYNIPVDPTVEICTYLPNNRGNCQGDSGSPLVRTDLAKFEQIGVVSWGLPCAQNAPDMYARVSAFKDFIVNNTATIQ